MINFLIMHNTGSDLGDFKGILLSISTYLKDFHLILTSNMHFFLIINNKNKRNVRLQEEKQFIYVGSIFGVKKGENSPFLDRG